MTTNGVITADARYLCGSWSSCSISTTLWVGDWLESNQQLFMFSSALYCQFITIL